MRLNHFSIGAALFALLLCTACASQPERRGPPPGGERGESRVTHSGMVAKPIGLFLATLDRDGDLIVDEAELEAGIAQEWDRLSDSHQASALQFKAWSQLALGSDDTLPSFIAFDHDLDGRFTLEDFGSQLRYEFERLDADNSGTLTRSELVSRLSRPSPAEGAAIAGERRRGEGRGRPRS
ncbi:MAG: hypothetical protein AAF996_04905 [Pseudomonadota bacterium]